MAKKFKPVFVEKDTHKEIKKKAIEMDLTITELLRRQFGPSDDIKPKRKGGIIGNW